VVIRANRRWTPMDGRGLTATGPRRVHIDGTADTGPREGLDRGRNGVAWRRAGACYARTMQRYAPTTALIVVDLQNDFADPAGGLAVAGGDAIIPTVDREISMAMAAGATVVFTQDWHPATTPHFAKDGGVWPVHCVADTWGAAIHPAVEVPAAALLVRKGANGEDGYSGFTMRDPVSGVTVPTELEGLLRERSVTEVVVVGLATDYCVKATALDAQRLGFATRVLTDAVAAVDLSPGDGARAIEEMRAAGVVLWRAVMR
jgi:nicotinamidase/pyrazinamidase